MIYFNRDFLFCYIIALHCNVALGYLSAGWAAKNKRIWDYNEIRPDLGKVPKSCIKMFLIEFDKPVKIREWK